jgi:hypothetical protein
MTVDACKHPISNPSEDLLLALEGSGTGPFYQKEVDVTSHELP